MDKEQLIEELSLRINSGELSRDEIIARLGLVENKRLDESKMAGFNIGQHLSVTKMLYVLGGGVVVIGAIIFIAQIWDDMGSFGHILITLGLGLLMSLLGSVLLKQRPETELGTIFYFIGGMLIPGGALVTLDEFNLHTDWSFALVFIGVFVFYLVLNFVHRNAVLTFFAIANGTLATYLTVTALFDPILDYNDMEVLFQYLTMILGVSYVLLAHSFKDGWNDKLIGALNFFGVTGFLGASFARVFESGFWELFYFLVVFGVLFLSVYTKSRIFLIMSTIFLIAHITYITNEYFADSLGWPVALVILGFIFIGLGYASITINNKYIKGGVGN
ncbi:DUF2157 domain-containing protein [Candidatus Kaiserbacteria bacterium]|nr:DUF2157 domain-containing protein [Candidatus Kaiserbacteria bacterium]USN92351.1 MAG: DUF2157 domain-containing protein [Candidatus Nomurabacteria bacterium]